MNVLLGVRLNRIGRSCLWYDATDHAYWVSLDNRTYHHKQRITPEKVAAWHRAFRLAPPKEDETPPLNPHGRA